MSERKPSGPSIKLIQFAIAIIALVGVSGCLGGGGGFDNLTSGSVQDLNELTIDQAIPDVSSLTVEVGATQNFFVSARAPTGRVISYTWTWGTSVVGSGQPAFSLTGTSANIGTSTLTVTLTDGVETKSKSWTVKVNGPPSITPITTGTPKVSVGSSVVIQAQGTDPNNDNLTYTWKLNGVTSSYLVGSGASATLTGDDSIVGSVNVTATVSDGTDTADYTWAAEINYFPNACNQLTTGQICTYSGSPSLGDSTNPLNSSYPLKISPIAHVQDDLGNYFLADYANNIIWYWNKTSSSVSRLGVTVPANTIKVVAGTGEAANGADGIALDSGINGPRGLVYHPTTQRLYISEYGSSRVRFVDNNGFIYTGMGGGSSNTDGASAYTSQCYNPAGMAYDSSSDSIYVACRGNHRVKRWDLSTDTTYTVLGNGSGSFGSMPAAPTSVAAGYPYNLYLTSDGLYVAHMEMHRVTFLNLSGSSKTFWNSTTPVTIPSGEVGVIIGNGSGGAADDIAPTAGAIGDPAALVVQGDTVYLAINYGSNDTLYAANNTASDATIGGVTVGAGKIKKLLPTTAGYNGSGVDFSRASINNPYDLTEDSSDPNALVFSDYGNNRLRYFDMSAAKVYDIIGSGKARYGFYGDTLKPTMEHLFQYITGVVFDNTTHDLFFTDSQNCRIRRTDAYGRTETAVGRGCGSPTIDNDVPSNSYLNVSLSYNDNNHAGLYLMPDDSLIISNNKANNVRIWNRTDNPATYFNVYVQDDKISNLAGDYLNQGNGPDGPALSTQMYRPSQVAYDSVTGDLFILDSRNDCIRTLDSTGTLTATLGTCGTSGNAGSDILPSALTMNMPTDIALDSNRNLVIADRSNHKVRYYNRGSSAVTIGPITIDAGKIVTIACLNGNSGSTVENILSQSASCNLPTGLAVNSNYICFSNQGSHNVRCITLTGAEAGRINTVAGHPQASVQAGSPYGFEQEGITATMATLYYPSALSFDSNGDLYIADTYNHIVRKVKLSP